MKKLLSLFAIIIALSSFATKTNNTSFETKKVAVPLFFMVWTNTYEACGVTYTLTTTCGSCTAEQVLENQQLWVTAHTDPITCCIVL